MEEIEKHWDQFSKHYSIHSRCLAPMSLQLWNMLKVEEANSILDMGCGPGYLLPYLSQIKKPKCRVVALDLSQQMVRIAIAGMDKYASQQKSNRRLDKLREANLQSKMSKFYPQFNMTISNGNSEDLIEIKNESFQVYSSSLVLQLTQNTDQMLKEAHRVLQPHGRIGCSVWGSKENSNLMTIFDEVLDQNNVVGDQTVKQAFHMNDRKALIELFQQHNFKNISQK